MLRDPKTKSLILLYALLILGCSSWTFAGELKGVVVEEHTQNLLSGATVVVGSVQTTTDAEGEFSVSGIPVGEYTVTASMTGYEAARIENVMVADLSPAEMTIELDQVSVTLEEIIVTPGRFTLMRKEPTVQQTLKRDDLRSVPQLGEDIYRAIARLPGLATDDYSARFAVRGGENDEVLVLLDGMELYEPFHLKDFNGGILSIIDVETIGGIDMMTGAFPAAYGNRLSGVFDIDFARPSFVDRRRTSLALSFMNARFLTEGYFDNQRGYWLFAARRGYLDLILQLAAEEDVNLSPIYYDVSGKLSYDLNQKHKLSASVLWADDDLDIVEEPDVLNTGYGNGYTWVTWEANIRPEILAQTVLSVGRVTKDRQGTDRAPLDGALVFDVSEQRSFDFVGLKQDWTFELSEKHLLTGGLDAKRLDANYDYASRYAAKTYRDVDGELIREYESVASDRDISGNRFGAYLGERVRLAEPLTAEIGIRYDHFSWTDDNNLSPRLNLAVALGDRTVVRGGWGQFYQAQGIRELDVQDGDEEFYPAELAEHRAISVEHVLDNGTNLRIEAYQKVLSDIRPYYLNLARDLVAMPEVEYDRVRLEPERGESEGVEILIKRDTGDRLSWWASYAYAIAEDEVDGQQVPRSFDQRHTVSLDLNYRPNPQWRLNIAWQFHSGWPYTARHFEPVERLDGSIGFQSFFGPVNAERFPAYHRLDVRVHRYLEVGDGHLSIFAEVTNLYNRSNMRRRIYYVDVLPSGELEITEDSENWFSLLPSVGVSWEF